MFIKHYNRLTYVIDTINVELSYINLLNKSTIISVIIRCSYHICLKSITTAYNTL
jgi:hypothetical protein